MAAIVDAESIRDGLLAEHPATVYADRIQRNSQDLLDTLNRVQSKLSISALNLTLLDLRKPMEDALALVRLEGIQVERNMEDPAPKALVDANHLRETLVNILQNAVQSMTGPVRRLRIEIGQSRWWANISISDSGCGIQKEDLHRVFVPFYTTKDRRNNWGLGLPYAYRIVMAHRGKLFIDSEPGNGTMVKILLPLIE
jgi:signal transduction histidine kinase